MTRSIAAVESSRPERQRRRDQILTYGHGAVTAGPCPDSIVLNFLTHPDRKPDTSCVAQLKMLWQ